MSWYFTSSYTHELPKNLAWLKAEIECTRQLLRHELTVCHFSPPSQYLSVAERGKQNSPSWTTIVWYGYQLKHQHGNQGNCSMDLIQQKAVEAANPCDKIDLKHLHTEISRFFSDSFYLKYQWCLRLAKIALLGIVTWWLASMRSLWWCGSNLLQSYFWRSACGPA